MRADGIQALSEARLAHAEECLDTAKKIIAIGDYKCAANRSYYAVFHAMRAVLAYDRFDSKKHSGVIAEFRRLYVKTGVFNIETSDIVSNLFDIRTNSDYDDFFIVSKEDVEEQVANAEKFVVEIKQYLDRKKQD